MTTTRAKTKIFLNNKINSSFNSKDSNDSIKSNKQIVLNKGPWTEKEDQLLKNWVEKYGASNWTKCSEYIKGRSGKQCREHWNNSLDPKLLKGQWTSEEDLLIMLFYKKYGGSWKKIIPIFEKRTENSIKNRFFSQLRKIASRQQQLKKKEYSSKFGLEELKSYLPLATDLAKQKFFNEKTMSEKELDEYVIKIDNMVKNRKKGKKFIDLNIIKNSKNFNNTIEIRENTEEDIYSEEENVETEKKRRKKRKKNEKNYIKNKEEEIVIKDDGDLKEELLTYEETVNPTNFQINKDKDIEGSHECKTNTIFESKKSKKKIIFNETKNEDKKEEEKENQRVKDDIFLAPLDKVINNNNNSYNYNNIINGSNNKKEINVNKYNDYKIKRYNKEEDIDGQDSEDEINKQIKNAEKQTIRKHRIRNRFARKIYNSKKIDNDIEKGKLINPCISFDNLEHKETRFGRNNSRYMNNYERKKSNKDSDFNFYNNISYGNGLGNCRWTRSSSGLPPIYFDKTSKLFS